MVNDTMKAVIAQKPGGPEVLAIIEQAIPQPKANELLVKVHACALNRADILQRKGKYPIPPGASNILGLEIAGEIAACGAEVTDRAVGECVFGLVSSGAYAEYCIIDADMAMPIPNALHFTEAAALPEAFFTADEALFQQGLLCSQESVLIHAGTSGVGSAAIQMAHHIGATVYTTASTKEKVDFAIQLGAITAINYKEQDFKEILLTLTNNQGIDVIIDFIGGDYFPQHLDLLKPHGRLVQVAFMNGAYSNINLRTVLNKQLQIKGMKIRPRSLAEKRLLAHRFQTRWLPAIVQQRVKPIIDSQFALHDVARAHAHMEANRNIGKIILVIE